MARSMSASVVSGSYHVSCVGALPSGQRRRAIDVSGQ
jgi:hypothetical protein